MLRTSSEIEQGWIRGVSKELADLFSPSPVISSSNVMSSNFPGDGDASRSLALQSLYANNAVKRALLEKPAFDTSYDSDDDDWEDTMDSITFCTYYAAANLVMAQIVQDHDRMCERLNHGIGKRNSFWIFIIRSRHGWVQDSCTTF